MRIFLVGYMGSGKSKVAEALSKLLKFDVLHTDQLVEEAQHKTISEIFNTEGQELFREMERAALQEAMKKDNVVISTGGGLPVYSDNMDLMNASGITVYLEANPGLLFHRLVNAKQGRPLIEKLDDVELMEQISGHLAIRSPYYNKAKMKVNAASVNVKELSEKLQAF